MARIIDLTMAIEDHFRWPVRRELAGDFARGDLFQITRLTLGVHGFTHMDSPRHILPDGPTTDTIPLEATVGDAAVVDLSDVAPNEAIEAGRLETAAGHVERGDRVVFRTTWERQRSPRTPEFWTEAPYLTRGAAEWLLERGVRTVAYDFPQDYTIRLLLQGEVRPMAEHVTHDVLLRSGVAMIEYLSNTVALTRPRTWLCALPLKLEPGADGAPARVIAVEE
jgi:arylformamidase